MIVNCYALGTMYCCYCNLVQFKKRDINLNNPICTGNSFNIIINNIG